MLHLRGLCEGLLRQLQRVRGPALQPEFTRQLRRRGSLTGGNSIRGAERRAAGSLACEIGATKQ